MIGFKPRNLFYYNIDHLVRGQSIQGARAFSELFNLTVVIGFPYTCPLSIGIKVVYYYFGTG